MNTPQTNSNACESNNDNRSSRNNSSCGHNQQFDGASAEYKRALWIVIAINAFMFLFEIIASFYAQSQALQADALDFLMDSATYTISLLVIGKSIQVRSTAALLKGYSLAAIAVIVLVSTFYQVLTQSTPHAPIMASMGAIALFANLLSLMILIKFRDGDSNVRSVWLCSRNDAIGNVLVILSAIIIYITNQPWPDLIVAILLASLFLKSAVQIIRQARQELVNQTNKQ